LLSHEASLRKREILAIRSVWENGELWKNRWAWMIWEEFAAGEGTDLFMIFGSANSSPSDADSHEFAEPEEIVLPRLTYELSNKREAGKC
jgi:hypothetical protein